jgi:2-dehydro-3-deoxyphosphogluconate aldolase / (4S)-4-hydroxy-2-oxoglutarate aldolase
MPESLLDIAPVIPVVVIDDLDTAVPLAHALVDGGLPIIELILRTPTALAAIRLIADEVPEILVGAGTITSPRQAKEAAAAGAQFLVSPGTTPDLLLAMSGTGLPFLPGTATISEMLTVLETGRNEMKLFPAAQSGGVDFLKAVAGPLPQVRFCPTGGIRPQTAPDYLALPNVGCVGGTWIAPADLLATRDFNAVTERAAEAAALR